MLVARTIGIASLSLSIALASCEKPRQTNAPASPTAAPPATSTASPPRDDDTPVGVITSANCPRMATCIDFARTFVSKGSDAAKTFEDAITLAKGLFVIDAGAGILVLSDGLAVHPVGIVTAREPDRVFAQLQKLDETAKRRGDRLSLRSGSAVAELVGAQFVLSDDAGLDLYARAGRPALAPLGSKAVVGVRADLAAVPPAIRETGFTWLAARQKDPAKAQDQVERLRQVASVSLELLPAASPSRMRAELDMAFFPGTAAANMMANLATAKGKLGSVADRKALASLRVNVGWKSPDVTNARDELAALIADPEAVREAFGVAPAHAAAFKAVLAASMGAVDAMVKGPTTGEMSFALERTAKHVLALGVVLNLGGMDELLRTGFVLLQDIHPAWIGEIKSVASKAGVRYEIGFVARGDVKLEKFGDDPTLVVASRKDALVIAFGPRKAAVKRIDAVFARLAEPARPTGDFLESRVDLLAVVNAFGGGGLRWLGLVATLPPEAFVLECSGQITDGKVEIGAEFDLRLLTSLGR